MEVGRFFYGSFQPMPKHAHCHQEAAKKAALALTIGHIKEPARDLIFHGNEEMSVDLERTSWKLVARKMVTTSHAVLQFQAKDVTIAGALPYFDHCGKYYKVLSTGYIASPPHRSTRSR